ncbi:MAG TPA: toll/interleukin-1 receptor domain-containing protein [Solirubrobacteraceae bacterium]
MPDPAAFFSYAHADDEHDGALTRLHAALEQEIGLQLGADFTLFIDRDDIVWGESWRARIDESLDSATLLIPVITRRFFASEECRRELTRFLERERALGRGSLICPIYYVDAAPVHAPGGDDLAEALASRQYDDWRARAQLPRAARPRAQPQPAPGRRR